MNNATIAGFIPSIHVPHVIILTAVFVLSVFMIIIGIATCKLRQANYTTHDTTNDTTHDPTNDTTHRNAHRVNYGSITTHEIELVPV